MTFEAEKVAAEFIKADEEGRKKIFDSLNENGHWQLLHAVEAQAAEEMRAALERFGAEIRIEYEEQDARRMEQMAEIEDELNRLQTENQELKALFEAAMDARNKQARLAAITAAAGAADIKLVGMLPEQPE